MHNRGPRFLLGIQNIYKNIILASDDSREIKLGKLYGIRAPRRFRMVWPSLERRTNFVNEKFTNIVHGCHLQDPQWDVMYLDDDDSRHPIKRVPFIKRQKELVYEESLVFLYCFLVWVKFSKHKSILFVNVCVFTGFWLSFSFQSNSWRKLDEKHDNLTHAAYQQQLKTNFGHFLVILNPIWAK